MIRGTFIYLVFLLCTFCSTAQGYKSLSDKVDSDDVSNLSQGLDYQKTKGAWVPREFDNETTDKDTKDMNEPVERESNSRSSGGSILSFIYYGLLGALVVALIGGLVYFLSQIEVDESIDIKGEELLLDEAEDIRDLDLKTMLAKAITDENYKLAVRIKFLISLKSLTASKKIKWSKDKTNRDYSRELKGAPFFQEWQHVSNLFERVWYGDFNINRTTYDLVSPIIDRFEQTINVSKA